MARTLRWWVLAAYAAVMGVSQMLWLNFAPLLTFIEQRFSVSENTASLLIGVFPLLYVVLSLPAGAWTDRRGYRFVVSAGAWVMASASLIRLADGSFSALLVGQIGIALAQPFVVNGVTKLVVEWFPEELGAIATGLATMGMFLGMAAGMAATPPLVSAYGLRGAMAMFAGITFVSAAVFQWSARAKGPFADRQAPPSVGGFRQLLRDRRLVLLLVLSAIGLGVFNGVSTWLEQILAPYGISSEQAGLIGGALIVGGIVGSAIVPLLSDVVRRRRPFLIGCTLIAPAFCWLLCRGGTFGALSGIAFALGFFSMPSFALMLDMCGQVAGAERAGAATALLMLTGNAGGVAVIALVPALKQGESYSVANWTMVGLLAANAVIAFLMPETMSPRAQGSSVSAPA